MFADKLCPLCWPFDHFAFNVLSDGKCDLGSRQIENNGGERLTQVKDRKKVEKRNCKKVREVGKKER